MPHVLPTRVKVMFKQCVVIAHCGVSASGLYLQIQSQRLNVKNLVNFVKRKEEISSKMPRCGQSNSLTKQDIN